MLAETHRPALGLALSGSGNRTIFYAGFLESLQEQNIQIDYISACSGGSLAAAAFACGELEEFKRVILNLNMESLRPYLIKAKQRGGIYSLDLMEDHLRQLTKGRNFEEVRPLMSFVTVDIETGEQVNLCMGDIARAARISCTLPGVFDPIKWGNRTLVDGGLLSLVPLDALKQFPVDITVGINMRGTKHIFTQRQITLKKIYNLFARLLFLDEVSDFIKGWKNEDLEIDFERNPGFFSVLGKSLDVAIDAEKKETKSDLSCDIMINLKMPMIKRKIFSMTKYYYEYGREVGYEYGPQIKKLIQEKQGEKIYA